MSIGSNLTFLGPARCVACRRRSGWLCAECARAAAPPAESMVIKNVTQAVAPWSYEGGPRALILALKVRGMRSAAEPLATVMTACVRRAGLDPDVVTWVPARRRDKRKRGFDHAELLALDLAERIGLPALPLLVRRGHQQDQVGLDREQRFTNLASAFDVVEQVRGRVLLVDDLVTTGATAASCASRLRKAGASRIDLAVACRR